MITVEDLSYICYSSDGDRRRFDMDEQRIREIAEDAFKAHVRRFEIIRIDVEPRLDHDGDRVVDVNIYGDIEHEVLSSGRLLQVESDIISKAWSEVEDDLGFPLVHFYSESTLKRHDLAKSKRIRRN